MKYALLFLFMLFFCSCKEVHQEEQVLVELIGSPAGEHSSLPYLFSNGEKTLISWVERQGDSLATLRYAQLVDGQWQQASDIHQGNDWFVNWADFPVIAENNGNLLSHVLKKSSPGTYSYDVKLNVKPAGEHSWNTNLSLHTDGTPTEHGFVSALPYKEDTFFITWLDGRNTMENDQGERGAMTIRAAIVSAKGEVIEDSVLDETTCDCCQTTAAITANGPVVLYRDRSEEEIRDISIVRQVEGQWTAPKTIHADNWQIKGCPVNGPKAAAIGNSLAVTWFTAANNKAAAKMAFSEDGGAHFDAPISIAGTDAMGRLDLALVDRETALVSWMESQDGNALIKAMQVSRAGNMSEILTIAEIDASRRTGFPQMELLGNKVYFAWTAVKNDKSIIKTAVVNIESFGVQLREDVLAAGPGN